MKNVLLSILLTILPILASAETVEIDGIWYNLVPKAKEAEVTWNPNMGQYTGSYSGNIEILPSVTYNKVEYSVTSIGSCAFYNCSKLISVTISNSVTSIGRSAFAGCSSLTSIAIPNSVNSIDGVAFMYCTSLTSFTIPNSLTTIGDNTFNNCSGLTSVTIPNSVTSIEKSAFMECSGLTSITIPNSVTSIGNSAFYGCSGLTSVTIPNSVTSISQYAFQNCTGLTSVTIGSSVTYIGWEAFGNCDELMDVYCLAEKLSDELGDECLYTSPDAFQDSYPQYMTLHVPAASIEAYRTTEPWSQFKAIVALEGGDNPNIKKCATPEISYANGKLNFICETEDVEFVSEVIVDDAKKYYDASVTLSQTYNVTVYATKAGYENSDVATASLCWIDAEPKMEGVTNSVISVRAQAVLIQSNGNQLTISGADEGTVIYIYDTSGNQVGTSKASAGTTTINTSLRRGEISIVKIGERSVKVLMK